MDTINWRQELLVINFFQPIEKASSQFFSQVFNDPELTLTIEHKLDLESGGLTMNLLLSKGDFHILNSKVSLIEQQIINTMTQNNINFQSVVTMFVGSICEKMYQGLVPIFYKHFIETRTNLPKPEENVTMDSKV